MKSKNMTFKSLEDIYIEEIRNSEVYPIDDVSGDEFDVVEVPDIDPETNEFNYSTPNQPERDFLRPNGEDIVHHHLSELATELVQNGLCEPETVENVAKSVYDDFMKLLKWKQE